MPSTQEYHSTYEQSMDRLAQMPDSESEFLRLADTQSQEALNAEHEFSDNNIEHSLRAIEDHYINSGQLSAEEIQETRNSLGITEKLKKITANAREVVTLIKNKLLDFRVTYYLNKANLNTPTLSFSDSFVKLVASMSREDLARHPKLFELSKKLILYYLKNSEINYTKIDSLYGHNPGYLSRLYSDPEIIQAQKDMFIDSISRYWFDKDNFDKMLKTHHIEGVSAIIWTLEAIKKSYEGTGRKIHSADEKINLAEIPHNDERLVDLVVDATVANIRDGSIEKGFLSVINDLRIADARDQIEQRLQARISEIKEALQEGIKKRLFRSSLHYLVFRNIPLVKSIRDEYGVDTQDTFETIYASPEFKENVIKKIESILQEGPFSYFKSLPNELSDIVNLEELRALPNIQEAARKCMFKLLATSIDVFHTDMSVLAELMEVFEISVDFLAEYIEEGIQHNTINATTAWNASIFLNNVKKPLSDTATQGLVNILAREISITKNEAMRQETVRNLNLLDINAQSKLIPIYLDNLRTKSSQDQQMQYAQLFGGLLKKSIASLEHLAPKNEVGKRAVEHIGEFIDKYPIGGKGQTIAVLLAMYEYSSDKTLDEIFLDIERELQHYDSLIQRDTPQQIPEGLRASLGIEYEITGSTANAYFNLTNKELRPQMQNLADSAGIGQGNDAVFEIATKPADNPYLLLLELQLIQDLGFIDFNFQKEGYNKGSHGYHLTLGGEQGMRDNMNTNFLQNMLVISGWAGINAGKEVSENTFRGRTTSIRQRSLYGDNNVQLFENTVPSVELRALSLDTWEPFERTIVTSYYSTIALQALSKYLNSSFTFNQWGDNPPTSYEECYERLQKEGALYAKTGDESIKKIIYAWATLQIGILKDIENHNNNFLEQEMYGYLDNKGFWIDAEEFGGSANQTRFLSVTGDEENLKSYIGKTRIPEDLLFTRTSKELIDSCVNLTNLFIKPSLESGGDVVNANSILSTTKIKGKIEESTRADQYSSFFDTDGQTRKGYYSVQGGSEKMLIHAVQQRLLAFTEEMKEIVK